MRATSSAPTADPTREARSQSIALYHANIIRGRHETEDFILSSLEALIDFPLSPNSTSSCPSSSDVQAFKTHIRPFRPSDYDELIIERNINERCGYTLCPNRRIKNAKAGTWRLLGAGGKAADFKIVRKEELEKWCGDRKCAIRALWVKIQLDEAPAWERITAGSEVELLGERKGVHDDALAEGLARLSVNSEQALQSDENALALERGDRGMTARVGLVGVNIEEKVTGNAQPPGFDNDLSDRLEKMHLALEGLTPRFNHMS